MPRGRETILLVEDEPVVLRVAARTLEAQGYTANIMEGQGTMLDQASFIAKPFTRLALLEKVRSVLDGA